MKIRLLFNNFWLGEPATIGEIWAYRKAAGYTAREDVKRWWERTGVWWMLRLIPREIKYWVVIQAAVKGEIGNPGEVTSLQMLRKYEEKIL